MNAAIKSRLIFGAVPLLGYPFVALASLMSLAAHTTGKEPMLLLAVSRSFQIASLIYPIVYLGCLVGVLLAQKKKEKLASKIALVPIWFLGFVCMLVVLWMALDRT